MVSDPEMQRIFVPNFTTKSSGTGLGLAMQRNSGTEGKYRLKHRRKGTRFMSITNNG
jgi:signal transduction histidine kinase